MNAKGMGWCFAVGAALGFVLAQSAGKAISAPTGAGTVDAQIGDR